MNLMQARNLAHSLMREHDLQGWRFAFDNARSRGGVCKYSSKTISMSRYLTEAWDEDKVRGVLLHEIAHALTPGHQHDAVWQRKLISMGGDGSRTHSNETVPGRWLAVCDHCGVECGRRHRLTRQARYGMHRVCRKQVRWVDTGVAHRVG